MKPRGRKATMSPSIGICFLAFMLLAGSAHGLRLTDGLYFTVAPNSSAEVYFILPQDMGADLGKADYYVTTTSSWPTDLTEETITTEKNNTVVTPIRFYSADKKVGDCSNFTVRIVAPDLSLSKTWKGGVCLSKYADVEISVKGGDPKKVLNENVDLFSVGFPTYTKTIKPGEPASLELHVQSQASLTIDVSVQSGIQFEQKAFVVQTSQGSQYKTLYLNASSVPSGSYDIKATAKARNCSMDSCTKQAAMSLVASTAAPKGGFSVSLFPQELSIKKLEPVAYRFTIQNDYSEEKVFSAYLETPSNMDSSFTTEYITIPGLSEKTVNFTVTPRTQIAVYEIKLNVSAGFEEKSVEAYLKANEMVSDVYRNAEDALANANSSVKAAVNNAVGSWYNSYSGSGYSAGTVANYTKVQDTIDAAKKQSASNPTPSDNPDNSTDGTQDTQSNPLGLIIIPVALGGVVLVVLLLFRRKQQNEDGEVLESI